MLPEYTPFIVVAAFIIGTMLLLVINITVKNWTRPRTAAAAHAEETTASLTAEQAAAPEPVPVYPVYVDCSLSLAGYGARRL